MPQKILLLSCIFLSGCYLGTDTGFRAVNITVVNNKICAQVPKLERGQQITGVFIQMYHENQKVDWPEVVRMHYLHPYTVDQAGECITLPDYQFISGNNYKLSLLHQNVESYEVRPKHYFNYFYYEENYHRITLSRY